ncbi:MAG: phage protease [Kiritimatiellia bacterium]
MKNPELKQIESFVEPIWCHIAPFGEFEGRRGGETVTQLCDKRAFNRLIEGFKPEVLLDYEHRAENTDDTEAAGWIQDLALRDEGLFALIKFTDRGADAVRNRRLRFLSPVWPLDEAGRPVSLKSCALTNTPNFKLRPVLNKAAPDGENQTQEKGEVNMKELAALFGLPETATEAEILAAAQAAFEKTAELETKLGELESTALNTEAEKVADENEDKIENKASFIECYVANKEFALKMLENIKAPAVPAAVANKAAAKTPPAGWGKAVQNKLEQYRAMESGKEKDAFLAQNKDELLRLENQQ